MERGTEKLRFHTKMIRSVSKPHEIIQQNRPLIGNDTDPTLAVTFSVTLSER